ncbi:MAG: hypothetical protein ACRD2F_09240, partial [Terriglobales bacterium]
MPVSSFALLVNYRQANCLSIIGTEGCVTGEVAERLRRKWTCVEMRDDYVQGALGRFERPLEPE